MYPLVAGSGAVLIDWCLRVPHGCLAGRRPCINKWRAYCRSLEWVATRHLYIYTIFACLRLLLPLAIYTIIVVFTYKSTSLMDGLCMLIVGFIFIILLIKILFHKWKLRNYVQRACVYILSRYSLIICVKIRIHNVCVLTRGPITEYYPKHLQVM